MTLKLDRLFASEALVDAQGRPTRRFQQIWQNSMQAIETAFNTLETAVIDIQAAQNAANAANTAAAAAQSAANNAQSAADNAQTVADTVTAQSNLVNSYPSGLTLGASDAGASATISVSAHSRVYADGTSVAVNAGNLTGLAYSTKYYVYYDDPSRAGGAVTYHSTTSAATAAQTGNRHLVGEVTTPAALGAPTTGAGVDPPGVGAIP